MELVKPMRLIKEEEVPDIKRGKTDWLEILKTIPVGQAWAVTEGDIPIALGTLEIMVNRMIKKKLLSERYRVVQRKEKDKATVYVIHEAEAE